MYIYIYTYTHTHVYTLFKCYRNRRDFRHSFMLYSFKVKVNNILNIPYLCMYIDIHRYILYTLCIYCSVHLTSWT